MVTHPFDIARRYYFFLYSIITLYHVLTLYRSVTVYLGLSVLFMWLNNWKHATLWFPDVWSIASKLHTDGPCDLYRAPIVCSHKHGTIYESVMTRKALKGTIDYQKENIEEN